MIFAVAFGAGLLASCAEKTPVKMQSRMRGEYKDKTYKNHWANITFAVPDGWQVFEESQLAQLAGVTKECYKTAQNFEHALKANPAIYDFYALNPLTNSSFAVCYYNLQQTVQNPQITSTEYANLLIDNLQQLDMQDMQISPVYQHKLGWQEYTVFDACCKNNGKQIDQVCFLAKKQTDMIAILLSGYEPDDILQLSGFISGLESV